MAVMCIANPLLIRKGKIKIKFGCGNNTEIDFILMEKYDNK